MDWEVVQRPRFCPVSVYKETRTGIHYILNQRELDNSAADDCIWARAVVELSPNHFVFVEGHYSSDGDLSVKDFFNQYVFVRRLDLRSIKTMEFEPNDPRVVYCMYKHVISF